MPSRPWLVVAAAGWLSVSLTLAQDVAEPAAKNESVTQPGREGGPERYGNPATEQQPPADLAPAILRDIEAAIRDLIPGIDQTVRTTQDQREQADLRAQQDMAFWAEGMFWATCAAVLMTLVGIMLIWRTLRYTRDAAETTKLMLKEAGIASIAADKTANAAERQIDASREAMIADQRAWMEIEPLEQKGLKKTAYGFAATFIITCRNVGKSPALNCSIDIAIEPAMNPWEACRGYVADWKANAVIDPKGDAVFPDRTIRIQFQRDISINEISRVIAEENASTAKTRGFGFISVAVHCSYRTVLDEIRRSTIHSYCFMQPDPSNPHRPVAIDPDGDGIPEGGLVQINPIGLGYTHAS